VNVVDWSPVLQVAPKTGTVDELYRALHSRHPQLTVYRREAVPAYLHFSGHPRIPPIIALAADGWAITSRARFEQNKNQPNRRAASTGTTAGIDPCTACSSGPDRSSAEARSCPRSRASTSTS